MISVESKQTSDSSNSGKLVIIGIVVVAFLAAGAGWWFRYSATHRAAAFWGPEIITLIRDARVVEHWVPSDAQAVARSSSIAVDKSELHDVSSAKGLLHLRNALLEDHNFDWPAGKVSPDIQWTQGLRFFEGSTGVLVMFSPDFKFVRTPNSEHMLSCEPMAKGLREMFGEFAGESSIGKLGPAAAGPAGPIGAAPSAPDANSPK